jgi:Fe-S oxidoreductase
MITTKEEKHKTAGESSGEKSGEEKGKQVFIEVYIMGKLHKVPFGLTIMKAMEYAGYRFVRGAGCRAGFCGACSTVYRMKDDYKLQTALACQATAEEGMYLTQIPFVPANKARYDMEDLTPETNPLLHLYPEIARCVSCNLCTRSCPQDLEVMDYIQASLRGDIEEAARLSFDCIQCGLCTVRCMAEISHYHVGQLARRLYGKYLSPVPEHLISRMDEIKNGDFDDEMSKLMKLSTDELKTLYKNRDVEGGD